MAGSSLGKLSKGRREDPAAAPNCVYVERSRRRVGPLYRIPATEDPPAPVNSAVLAEGHLTCSCGDTSCSDTSCGHASH